MRKLALVVVALALLAACSSGGSGSGSLASLESGSGSYYVQGSSASKALTDGSISGSLMRIEAGEAGAVTWYDEGGSAVSVAINNARTLSDGRLVLGVTYSGEDAAYIADTEAGSLTELSPIPEGWTYARESGGSLYYIASGAIYSASLSTGAASLVSPAGEGLDAGAWLIVPSYGGVVYVTAGDTYEGFPAQRYYPGAVAEGLKTNLQLPAPGGYTIEGLDGTVYALAMIGSSLTATPYEELGTSGDYVAGSPVSLEALSWSSTSGALSVGGADTRSAVLANEGGAVYVVATSEGLASVQAVSPSAWDGLTYYGSGETLTVATGGEVIHAFHEIGATGPGYDVERYHIWRVPLGSPVIAAKGIGSAPEELLTDRNVSGLVAVGGSVFYSREADSGARETMLLDPATGTATVYASGEVTIAAIE